MKTPEQLAEALRKEFGESLKSVIVYGSSVVGDTTKKYSDINVLVLVDRLDFEALKKAAPWVQRWMKHGHPAPFFFTADRIQRAGDVFPLEFLDIKDVHRVVYGADPFDRFTADPKKLRHELEYELRGKLIHLRERYMAAAGREKEVRVLLAEALSPITALFKGVLRLTGDPVPAKKEDVWAAVHRRAAVDSSVLREILELRDGRAARNFRSEETFRRLLESMENVVAFVDGF